MTQVPKCRTWATRLSPTAGPGCQRKGLQYDATFLGEQLFLPAKPLAHGQSVQLVAQHSAQAHELVTMPEQLPEVAFGRGRNPDPREAFSQQQIENEQSVPLVGFLLADFTGANPRGIADPQFVTEFCQQPLEPVNRAGGFDAHAHRLR